MSGGATPLRLALIGCGHWGRIIARTIPRIEGTLLRRIASGNPRTADIAPDGCVIDTDWRDTIAAGDIDAVLIATPPATHAGIALASIRHGKPFFVEKPLTMDSQSAREICGEAEKNGVYGMVDHIHLFSPAFRKLCEMSPSLGPVHGIEACAGKNAVTDTATPVLWDWAPHDVAMCLRLLRQLPKTVRAEARPGSATGEAPHVNLRLAFGGNGDVSADMTFSNHFNTRRRMFKVLQRDGELTYSDDDGPRLTLRRRENAGAEDVPLDDMLPLDIALREFRAAVVSDSRSAESLQLGLNTVSVIEQADQTMSLGTAAAVRHP